MTDAFAPSPTPDDEPTSDQSADSVAESSTDQVADMTADMTVETTADSVLDDLPVEQAADPSIDLDAIESDFAAVETALARLAEGTYWTDETTGAAIPDDVMIADPTTRRIAQG